jgi:hypothetical protein
MGWLTGGVPSAARSASISSRRTAGREQKSQQHRDRERNQNLTREVQRRDYEQTLGDGSRGIRARFVGRHVRLRTLGGFPEGSMRMAKASEG